ncbi:MAG: DUF4364 family protein [Lachnospiraceae bacterium]|nr:DUF4364 family protein [Lachnospiraceae bacterium]
MQPEALMLYKLIVLYILDRVDFPMTNSQLADFITEKEYTNYFNVQQVLNELVDDGYISLQEAAKNSYLYRITKDGKETLSFFYKNISRNIRDDIDMFLTEKQYALREEVSNIADYYESKTNEYVCELKVIERDTVIIEIRLTVPTEDNAKTICAHWRQNNADIYAYVINVLLSNGSAPGGEDRS